MGRAFPEIPQVTMAVAGLSADPAVITDERGNLAILHPVDGRWAERLERAIAVELGGQASSSEYQCTVAQARGATVRGSVSRAVAIGRAAIDAERDPSRRSPRRSTASCCSPGRSSTSSDGRRPGSFEVT